MTEIVIVVIVLVISAAVTRGVKNAAARGEPEAHDWLERDDPQT